MRRGRPTESVWVFMLDTRAKLMAVHECARGGIDAAHVSVQEIFRTALLVGAHSIILAHNHPSGDPSPSAEDQVFTARVRDAADLLGVQLLDHVVVAQSGFYSFADAGDKALRKKECSV